MLELKFQAVRSSLNRESWLAFQKLIFGAIRGIPESWYLALSGELEDGSCHFFFSIR